MIATTVGIGVNACVTSEFVRPAEPFGTSGISAGMGFFARMSADMSSLMF